MTNYAKDEERIRGRLEQVRRLRTFAEEQERNCYAQLTRLQSLKTQNKAYDANKRSSNEAQPRTR